MGQTGVGGVGGSGCRVRQRFGVYWMWVVGGRGLKFPVERPNLGLRPWAIDLPPETHHSLPEACDGIVQRKPREETRGGRPGEEGGKEAGQERSQGKRPGERIELEPKPDVLLIRMCGCLTALSDRPFKSHLSSGRCSALLCAKAKSVPQHCL